MRHGNPDFKCWKPQFQITCRSTRKSRTRDLGTWLAKWCLDGIEFLRLYLPVRTMGNQRTFSRLAWSSSRWFTALTCTIKMKDSTALRDFCSQARAATPSQIMARILPPRMTNWSRSCRDWTLIQNQTSASFSMRMKMTTATNLTPLQWPKGQRKS